LRFCVFLSAHRREHAAQLLRHFFHAGRRHNIDTDVHGRFDFDFATIERAFAQLLAHFLARIGIAVIGLSGLAHESVQLTFWDQCVEDAFFGAILSLGLHLRLRLVAHHFHGHVGEVAHDLFDILADITDFGKFRRFHLDERRVRQMRETARDLGFADTGRSDHQNIFRRDFVAQRRIELHAPPAIAQRDRHRAFGGVLADDVAVEFVDDFARREIGHGGSGLK